MSRTVTLIGMALVLVFIWKSDAASETCPKPLPPCTSSSPGTLAQITGPFSCTGTVVGSGTAGPRSPAPSVHVQVLEGNSDGAGNITGKVAENQNAGGLVSLFKGFQPHTATYCVNTDGTGYIFPENNHCPLAFTLDSFQSGQASEVRLLGTGSSSAYTIVCKRQ
jgi:hypothetical protein